MADFLVTEKQFQYINELILQESNYELAQKNWEKFSSEEKNDIIECLKQFYPDKAKLIKEASWYNTLGDVIGLFDPTGVVDLVNGISYIRQGDNLFGFLSLISAVPYVGDVVAKPVMGALKLGAPSAKALEKVLKLVKDNKFDLATKELNRITAQGGITAKFVNGFSKVAGKLRGYIERAPNSIFGGLKKTILQWFDLFEKGAKSGTALRSKGQGIVQGMKGIEAGTGGLLKLSKDSQIKQLNSLIDMAKTTPGVFSGYRTSKGLMSWKTVFGGMPQLIGRNKSVRALMRQTKWWAGFLDWMGLGNFVGPEEILKQMNTQELESKIREYNKTPQAQQNFESEFGATEQPEQTQTTTQQTTSTQEENPLANMFRNMLMGTINPLPGK